MDAKAAEQAAREATELVKQVEKMLQYDQSELLQQLHRNLVLHAEVAQQAAEGMARMLRSLNRALAAGDAANPKEAAEFQLRAVCERLVDIALGDDE